MRKLHKRLSNPFLVPLEQILEQEKETWQSFILYIA